MFPSHHRTERRAWPARDLAVDVIGRIASIALGVMFVVSGGFKLADGPAWPKMAADLGGRPLALALPWYESCWCASISGFVSPWAEIAATVTLLAFTVVIVQRLLDGSRPPCACFGSRSRVRSVAAKSPATSYSRDRADRGCRRGVPRAPPRNRTRGNGRLDRSSRTRSRQPNAGRSADERLAPSNPVEDRRSTMSLAIRRSGRRGRGGTPAPGATGAPGRQSGLVRGTGARWRTSHLRHDPNAVTGPIYNHDCTQAPAPRGRMSTERSSRSARTTRGCPGWRGSAPGRAVRSHSPAVDRRWRLAVTSSIGPAPRAGRAGCGRRR